MGETTEIFKLLREDARKRKDKRRKQNIETLDQADFMPTKIVNNGTTFLYRSPYPRSADFYPGTGGWKDNKTGKVRWGGAIKFMRWMKG